MSMHLHHPSLSMAGKKPGKQKFRNADEARKARELAADWEQLQKKWAPKVIPKQPVKHKALSPNMSTPRTTQVSIPSKVTPGGDCTKKETIMYTGENMLGIAVQHKSCLQPIFSFEAAKDSASMRR